MKQKRNENEAQKATAPHSQMTMKKSLLGWKSPLARDSNH